jgi:hypothetical protein
MIGWFAEERLAISDTGAKVSTELGCQQEHRCYKLPSSHEQIMRMMSEWMTGCQTKQRHKLFVSFAHWRNFRTVLRVFLTNASCITWSIVVKMRGAGRGWKNNAEKKRRGWRRDRGMLLKLLPLSKGTVGCCVDTSEPAYFIPARF